MATENFSILTIPISDRRMAEDCASPSRTMIRSEVIGIPINVISWVDVRRLLLTWAATRQSRYVCICNVHSVVTATQDRQFRHVLTQADLSTPDGAPVAWTLRRKGFKSQPRINGPDLMWRLCEDAQAQGVGIGLFGSSPATLSQLEAVLAFAFPHLKIGYVYSPPYRPIQEGEDAEICRHINMSGIGLLFVGLGCPKQEVWMAAHRGKIDAVMLGVGAAFDYHAGTIKRAPAWIQSLGFEWLHRLLSEPRRLWRRYFSTNTIFIAKTIADAVTGGFGQTKVTSSRYKR